MHKLLNRTGAARRTFANRSTKIKTMSELNAILMKRVNAYSIVCIYKVRNHQQNTRASEFRGKPDMAMGWVNPWVGLGQKFLDFGGLVG
jgi:hypothetical protein